MIEDSNLSRQQLTNLKIIFTGIQLHYLPQIPIVQDTFIVVLLVYESIPVNLRVPSENTLNRTVRWNTNRRMNTIPAVAKLDFSGSHRNSWTVKTLPAIGHGGFVEDTIRRAHESIPTRMIIANNKSQSICSYRAPLIFFNENIQISFGINKFTPLRDTKYSQLNSKYEFIVSTFRHIVFISSVALM